MIKGISSENCPVDTIREYVEECIRVQQNCLENGTPVPEDSLIPEKFVISTECMRFFMNSQLVDVIGENENMGAQFYWRASGKYPALEVKTEKDKVTGKYILTYLKEEASDIKPAFVWDSSTVAGKKGIVVVVKKEDALEDVYDLNKNKGEE